MEKLNFEQLLKKYDAIIIPKIQRDYAQGRKDKKSNAVREHLLRDIFTKENTIDFDFIFGTKQDKAFIPLDGQQRLTTLYLLYLYRTKSKLIANTEVLDLTKFTYETRHAAKDFCKAIVENNWETSDIPSRTIKNSTWFMDYWKYDPTVESMLTMLDDIHTEASKGYYPDLSKITFYFFDMDEHGLSEELYLKMNSRGKPLTAFENLKADIDSILPSDIKIDAFVSIDNEDEKSGETFSDKWKYFIDRKWTDLFWRYKDEHNLIDSAFIIFMANILACYWAVNIKKIEGKDATNELISKKDGVFWQLINLTGKEDFIDFRTFKKVFELNDGKAFHFLARTLSVFSEYFTIINEQTQTPFKQEDEDSLCLIENICKGKVTNKIRALFFAVALYPRTDFESNQFSHWIRIIWNMIENSNLNGVSELQLIKELAENLSQQDIYEILKNYPIKEKTFSSEQLQEEKEKAIQILNDTNSEWEGKICEAEKFAFFKGAIRFLYTNEKWEVDWNNFATKFSNAKKYFDDKGVKDSDEKYKTDALLLKAFISSQFTKVSQLQDKYILDNQRETWKDNILLKSEYSKAINNILNGQICISENIDPILNKICNSNLLNYLAKEKPSSRVHWIHNHWSIYPYGAGDGVFINYDKRDKLLSDLLNRNENPKLKISNRTNRIFDNSFIYGWYVQFEYNGYSFTWYPHNMVFIQKNKNITTMSFSVTEKMKPSDFLEKCDNLIISLNTPKSLDEEK